MNTRIRQIKAAAWLAAVALAILALKAGLDRPSGAVTAKRQEAAVARPVTTGSGGATFAELAGSHVGTAAGEQGLAPASAERHPGEAHGLQLALAEGPADGSAATPTRLAAVTAVPEPASSAMLLAGLALVIARARRRKS